MVAHCEDLTGGGVASVLSRTGDSEAAGGCSSCLWSVAGASGGGACWWTVVSSSKNVVRVTSNHLVLSGVPDHKTFTAKVLGDHTWEVSVTSPREVPVVHGIPSWKARLTAFSSCLALNADLLLTDFRLQVRVRQIQWTLNVPVEQQFRR